MTGLNDFARLQLALRRGNFMETLYKAGLEPVAFARIAASWSDRLATDPSLRAEYAKLLDEPSPLAPPPAYDDAVVFPGAPLSRASDFARIGRAAKRGQFNAALARAGVDADGFAAACARFNARMQAEPRVAKTFARLVADPRID